MFDESKTPGSEKSGEKGEKFATEEEFKVAWTDNYKRLSNLLKAYKVLDKKYGLSGWPEEIEEKYHNIEKEIEDEREGIDSRKPEFLIEAQKQEREIQEGEEYLDRKKLLEKDMEMLEAI